MILSLTPQLSEIGAPHWGMCLRNWSFPQISVKGYNFKLYNIVLVLPNIEMNPPQVYMCSPSSLPIPSLWVVPVHQPQASSIVHRIWTGDSFHIWYYMYFNVILPNHPTLSLNFYLNMMSNQNHNKIKEKYTQVMSHYQHSVNFYPMFSLRTIICQNQLDAFCITK